MSIFILSIISYPLIITIYNLMIHSAFGDSSRMFHLTIPEELQGSSELMQIQKKAKNRARRALAVVISLLVCFSHLPSVWRTIIMLYWWMLITLYLFIRAYYYSYLDVRELITLNYCKKNDLPICDLGHPERLPWFNIVIYLSSLVIPTILGLRILFDHSLINHITSLHNDIVLFYLRIIVIIHGILLFKRRCRVLSTNMTINQQFHKLYKKSWNQCFLFCSVLNICLSIALHIFNKVDYQNFRILFIYNITYFVLYLLLPLTSAFYAFRLEYRWIIRRGLVPEEIQEDVYWMYGLIYYNQEDPHLFSRLKNPDRRTFNLGSKKGMLLRFFVSTLLVSLLYFSTLAAFWKFAPLKLEIIEFRLAFIQMSEVYSIDLNRITDVQLLQTLPPELKVSKHDFIVRRTAQSSNYGRCRFYLQNHQDYYIRIQTRDAQYIISSNTSEATVDIYHKLKGECSRPVGV